MVNTLFHFYFGTNNGVLTLETKHIAVDKWKEQRMENLGLPEKDVVTLIQQPDHPRTLFAGTYGNGLFRSLDLGKNWDPVGTAILPSYIRAMCFAPRDPDTLFVGTEPAGVFRSTDGGTSWENLQITTLPESSQWFLPYSPRAGAARTLAIHPSSPKQIFAGIEQGGLLRSKDGGSNWSIENEKIHKDVHELSLNPHDAQNMFVATGGGVYRTKDGGEHWKQLLNDYTRAIDIHPKDPRFVIAGPAKRVGHDGRVMISEDGGDTWSLASDGLNAPMEDMVRSFVLKEELPNEIFMISASGKFFHTSLDEKGWERMIAQETTINCLELQMRR